MPKLIRAVELSEFMTTDPSLSLFLTSAIQAWYDNLEQRMMALNSSSGYVAASNLQDLTEASLPIFNVERVQLQFSMAADFVAAQVANNVLILALATGRILRIDLDNPADIDGILPSVYTSKALPRFREAQGLMVAYSLQTSISQRSHQKPDSSVACFSTRLLLTSS